MAKEYFGVRATTALTRLIKSAIATKQDKLAGTKGQVLGFDEDGNPVAQEAPVTGMTQDAADERYVQNTDERLTDSRDPTSHASTHAAEGDDPITPESIGAMEAVTGETNQYVGFDEDGKPIAKDMSAEVELPEHLVRAEDEGLPDVALKQDADTLDGHPADYFASKQYVDEKEVTLPEHLIVGSDDELPDEEVATDADTLGGHSPDYYASKEYVDGKEVKLPAHMVSAQDSDMPDEEVSINADTLGGKSADYFASKEYVEQLIREYTSKS